MSCPCAVHFDQQLLDHIEFRENAEAKSMLNEELANSFGCRGTLLHHAAAVGNDVISKYLIDMGCGVDFPGPGDKTPLMIAVERGSESVTRVLLEAGADINTVDGKGESALYKALHSSCIDFEIVRVFLLRAKAESPSSEELIERLLVAGCTFAYFVLLREVDILQNLLQRGFDVNERACMERTALHFAALIKDFRSAELLVARGADVNAADYCSAGPLYYAAEGADPDMLRFLLDHGANPLPDVRFIGQTPLYACFIVRENDAEKVRECAELLLERGAFPWQPHLLIEQVQLSFSSIFRSSRLNGLVAHQAALDAFGVQSCEDEEHLTTFVELKEYYDNCRKILEVVVSGNMRLVNLLYVDSDHEIRLRARDQAFVRQVEQFCSQPTMKDSFPYYAKILRNQTAKAVRAVELEKEASLVVCALFKCDYNQLSIFARQVVGYLSEHDLEQLRRV